uniref:AlNc14C25G2506 protein n=1 Tax=Albugo laibachii Nc14 TaxID=890382 RepID=F0W6L8_9STRA|nr:AlNc14C25G2506 [Albugo laibachii Nc14]|eukprot:CCA16763.1 AlNc14C25G2506 [Albugo laibachii Nc14]
MCLLGRIRQFYSSTIISEWDSVSEVAYTTVFPAASRIELLAWKRIAGHSFLPAPSATILIGLAKSLADTMKMVSINQLVLFEQKMSRCYSRIGSIPSLKRKLCELAYNLKAQKGREMMGTVSITGIGHWRSRVSFIFAVVGVEQPRSRRWLYISREELFKKVRDIKFN